MKPFISSRKPKILKILLPTAFWLTVWWALAALVNQELLLPSPLLVGQRLAQLALTPLFWQSAGCTLLRVFGGGLLGCVSGCALAALTCCLPAADLLLAPAVRVIRAVPVASFIILALLWVKTDLVPLLISGLMVLPVIWQNISAGLKNLDPLLLELARAYQFNTWQKLRYIVWPQVRPYAVSGLCTAIGLAWKAGVAAEVLCLPRTAIGSQVYFAKLYLESSSLFAWTILVIMLSMSLEQLIRHFLSLNEEKKHGTA